MVNARPGRVEGWLLHLSYAEGDHIWSRVL